MNDTLVLDAQNVTKRFGGLTAVGLGIVGQYVWLTLQNARNRPPFIVESRVETEGHHARSTDHMR